MINLELSEIMIEFTIKDIAFMQSYGIVYTGNLHST